MEEGKSILAASRSETQSCTQGATLQNANPIEAHKEMGPFCKPNALGLDNPPPFHLVRRTSLPRRWEDAGLDENTVHILWSINSAADLVERRSKGKLLAARTYKDGSAIIWHLGPLAVSTGRWDSVRSLRIDEATATVEVWADSTLHVGRAECVVYVTPGPDGPSSLAHAGFCWRNGKEPPTRMRRREERLLGKWVDMVVMEQYD